MLRYSYGKSTQMHQNFTFSQIEDGLRRTYLRHILFSRAESWSGVMEWSGVESWSGVMESFFGVELWSGVLEWSGFWSENLFYFIFIFLYTYIVTLI